MVGPPALNDPDRQVSPRRRWLRRVSRGLLLYVLVPYVAVTLIFVVFQRRLMYQPTVAANLEVTSAGFADEARDVRLETPEGRTLNGWLLYGTDDKEATRPLVLYFPGNSLNRYERISDLREMTRCGYDVLIFDYRGFGDSTGRPSEAAMSADARQVWDFACDFPEYAEERTVLFGESLGGAVALSLWSDGAESHPKPAAVILNATFTSMPDTVAWHYPYMPFRYLLLDRWPSIERIGTVECPVVIFHGKDDAFVPVSQARRLAEVSREACLIEIPGGSHNDVPMAQLRRELTRIRETFVGATPRCE